ncbi:MAG: hypothetical protein Q9191_006743 [Dirinaria sp. TL-2023a]
MAQLDQMNSAYAPANIVFLLRNVTYTKNERLSRAKRHLNEEVEVCDMNILLLDRLDEKVKKFNRVTLTSKENPDRLQNPSGWLRLPQHILPLWSN